MTGAILTKLARVPTAKTTVVIATRLSVRLRTRSLARPRPEKGGDGAENQLQVVQQRPRRDVDVVEPDHLLERDVIPSEHLPEAGDPGLQVETTTAPVDDVLILLEDEGTGADEAHLATDD